MKRTWILSLLVAVAGCQAATISDCGIERPRTYPEPPAVTYTAGTFPLKINGTTTSVAGATVTPEFFKAADVQALLGRTFMDADSAAGAPRVVILGRALWQQRFGADPAIIGQQIDIDERQATVVGITPPDYEFPKRAQVWLLKGGGMP